MDCATLSKDVALPALWLLESSVNCTSVFIYPGNAFPKPNEILEDDQNFLLFAMGAY